MRSQEPALTTRPPATATSEAQRTAKVPSAEGVISPDRMAMVLVAPGPAVEAPEAEVSLAVATPPLKVGLVTPGADMLIEPRIRAVGAAPMLTPNWPAVVEALVW